MIMNTFKQDCAYSATNGVLLLSCKHCANRHEMVYQDGGNIPICTECGIATGDDWLYSLESIDYLNKHYPIPDVLQVIDESHAEYESCMARIASMINKMMRR